MTAFQIFGVTVFGVLALSSGYRALSRRRERLVQSGWLLLWVMGAGAFLRPNLTREIARSLGVMRGADLVSYLTTLALLFFAFWMHGRLRIIERNLTILTRELALQDARAEADAPSSTSSTHSKGEGS